MTKAAGSLARGRRTRAELPPVPAELPPPQQQAQTCVEDLVQRAGGRYDATSPIPTGHLDVLTEFLDEWGRKRAVRRDGRLYFPGRPGLWNALDQLYPLQDPNRWDNLREALIGELQERGWARVSPPRGAAFYLPEK